MVRIDPLWIVICIEAIIALAGVCLFLAYKLFVHTKKRKKDESNLLKCIDTSLKFLNESISRIEERDTETSMRKRGLQLEVQIIEALRDSLKKGVIDGEAYNEGFYKKSQEAVTEFIEWFKKFTDKKDEIISRARAALKERDEALSHLQESLKKKKAQIQDLISEATKQKNILERWQIIKKQNKKLKEMITRLKEKAKEAEVLQEIVGALEATNKELSMCVEVLEQENNRLTEQLLQYQQMLRLFDESGQIIERLQNDEGVQKLLLDLREKNREIERLRKELQTLEKEYMNLYQRMAK